MNNNYAYDYLNNKINLNFICKVSSSFVDNKSYCSGVLIYPNIVATANHCLEYFKEDYYVQFPFGKNKKVKKVVHSFENSDVVFLELETAEEKIVPIKIFHDNLDVGSEVIVAGYGLSKNAYDLKFSFAQIIKSESSLLLWNSDQGYELTIGDSGSALLCCFNGKLRLCGINYAFAINEKIGYSASLKTIPDDFRVLFDSFGSDEYLYPNKDSEEEKY